MKGLKLDKKLYIGLAGILTAGLIYVAGFYDRSLFVESVYGVKWLLGLVVMMIVLAFGVSYFFVNLQKVSNYNKIFGQAILANFLSLVLVTMLIALAQKLIEPETLLDVLGGRYMVYAWTLILSSIMMTIGLYHRVKLVETSLSNGFIEVVNFIAPAVAFLLVGFFIPEFRFVLGVLVVAFFTVMASNELALGAFNNEK